MPYKPMPPKKYRKYIDLVGWMLKKGSIDWNLYDENGKFVCSIKIMHGKGKVAEVSARSVKKTEQHFKERGWLWPPKKR